MIFEISDLAKELNYSENTTRTILDRFNAKRIRKFDRRVVWNIPSSQFNIIKKFCEIKQRKINGKIK